MSNKKVMIPLIAAVVVVAAVLIVFLVIKPFNKDGKSSGSSKGGIEALEEHLKSKGVLDGERKELDPNIYKCVKAVEYTGAATIVEYDKDSEGFKLASSGQLESPEGEHIGFQGFNNTKTRSYGLIFDYSDYEGKHGFDWQGDFIDAFMTYKE